MPFILRNARVARDAEHASRLDIRIRNGVIERLQPNIPAGSDSDLDLQGSLVLPGLINAHDHLEFGLFPRLGNHTYPDARAWATDIYRPDESPIRELLQISKPTRLFWGGLKNLFAGVTTVCHHNPYEAEVFEHNFPVRVLNRYGWSHSLDFSENLQQDYEQTPPSAPFLMHLAEGTTAKSRHELKKLDGLGLLTPRTVLIHGVALGPEEWSLVRERKASWIWCPSSNVFTLGKTVNLSVISSGIPTALGSDSSLTAAGDLLDEIQFARQLGASPTELYALVTSSAAQVLGLREGEGYLREGGVADLLVVRDSKDPPAQRLASLSRLEIDAVVREGRILLASEKVAQQLPSSHSNGLCHVSCDGVEWSLGVDLMPHWCETVPILGEPVRLTRRLLRPVQLGIE
jgi:cytosine/adenosine deaminase-related metal-dependent hydrolase